MPELPEAETIARGLAPRLSGATITDVVVHHDDVLAAAPAAFADSVRGRTLAGAGRRGKNVVLPFEDGARLVVNLGMTGRLVLSDAPRAAELRHVAVRLGLNDGRTLLYDDIRRFGLLELFEPAAWRARDAALGLEPLDDAFTAEALHAMTRRTRVPIRNFLLDQYSVAGVGNIYAVEALFRAGIRPTRRGRTLTRFETARLRDALREVLRLAIENRGTTFSDYRDASGEAGGFEPLLRVYGREGTPCTACGTAIKRRVLANRSAFYCPRCQR
ncbi:MAG TPA: bifunctional DNA-formamidopyrimidine glycosylase/DNA-(apurinic or apyrimidinic site) lyase [Longimicrobiales bacterium]|nr:bifunctional DNA-formamidopyrimidine glycosylase/DNA-(apurinic or apyrimidinic site) lyase [Longimicrobiales bacterium]